MDQIEKRIENKSSGTNCVYPFHMLQVLIRPRRGMWVSNNLVDRETVQSRFSQWAIDNSLLTTNMVIRSGVPS